MKCGRHRLGDCPSKEVVTSPGDKPTCQVLVYDIDISIHNIDLQSGIDAVDRDGLSE